MGIRTNSVTWRSIAHEAKRCTFLTTCTSVTETLYHAYWVQFPYGYANLGCTRLAHSYGKYTENVIFSAFFVFFPPKIMVKKRRHYAAGITTLHMFHVSWCLSPCVHETELCIFLTINTFVSDKRCFLCIARICKQFDHLESTLDFKSSVQKALNNNKTMLFDVRFAFLLCINKELDCCMT